MADAAAAPQPLDAAASADAESSAAASDDAGYEATVAQSAAVEAALEGGLRVVLDLSYGAHMSAREHNSLQRQLSRCWGANRRAAAPVSLHLAGLAQCPAACLPPGGDHLRWKVHRLDERVEERFPPASLTFLTPDAPDVLGALDPARVYVIGGLVDRSVQKAASLARARGLGAATARLPLEAHSAIVDAREPLTLDAVLTILLEYNASADWGRAIIAALPERKLARPREEAARSARRKKGGSWNWGEPRREGGAGGGGEDEHEGRDGQEAG